jgi:hypothetical protein
MKSITTIKQLLDSCQYTFDNLKPFDNPHAKVIPEVMQRRALALLAAGYPEDDIYESSWKEFAEDIFG